MSGRYETYFSMLLSFQSALEAKELEQCIALLQSVISTLYYVYALTVVLDFGCSNYYGGIDLYWSYANKDYLSV